MANFEFSFLDVPVHHGSLLHLPLPSIPPLGHYCVPGPADVPAALRSSSSLLIPGELALHPRSSSPSVRPSPSGPGPSSLDA